MPARTAQARPAALIYPGDAQPQRATRNSPLSREMIWPGDGPLQLPRAGRRVGGARVASR